MPLNKGGLGLRRITIMNELLLAKLLWRWHKEEGECKNIQADKQNRDNHDLNHLLHIDLEQGGSMIWKNAQKFKNIIRKGVRWKVGNRRAVLFWKDTLILDHPLCDDPRWNSYIEKCKDLIGTVVVDYQKNDMWQDLKRVNDNLVNLNKCLNAIFLSQKGDDLIWKSDPSRMFSISLTYANLFDLHEEPCWARAWVKGLTPKINILFLDSFAE